MLLPRRPRQKRERYVAEAGFTLVEVLVSLSVLAIALVFVVGGLQTGIRAVKLAEQMTEAELLARAKMAELQQHRLNFVGSESGNALETSGDFGADNPLFRWRARAEPFEGDQNLWKLRVEVTWLERNAPRQVELSTLAWWAEENSRPGEAGVMARLALPLSNYSSP